ncbi:MAG: rhodanese-like domain-containing protein [Pseudomonadota bacterium]
MDQYIEFVSNHPYMFLALAATIGMIVYVEYERLTSGGKAVSPIALTRLQNDGALVIDVRDDNAFKSGHLIDSKHIPMAQLEKRVGEIERRKDDPVVLICENGMRAQRACKTLKKHGFSTLHHLAGGINAWQKANLPTASKA